MQSTLSGLEFVYFAPRLVGFFNSFLPFKQIPLIAKNILALCIALATSQIYSTNHTTMSGLGILTELFVGLIIGYSLSIPFYVFIGCGFIIDNMRGASIGAVFNPGIQDLSSAMSDLFMFFSLALFFSIGGGVLIFKFAMGSFDIYPVGITVTHLQKFNEVLMDHGIGFILEKSTYFALPIISMLLLVDTVLAILSKINPQLQVFFVTLAIKSAVALYMVLLFVIYGKETLINFMQHSVSAIFGMMA